MKRRNFTLSISQNMAEFQRKVEQCPKWAWIVHDSDIDTDGKLVEPHVHAYVEFPNPRSYASVADLLGVAENMVCKVYDKRAILQYFTHKNQPDKHQYEFREIASNFDVSLFYNNNDANLWQDYRSLRDGRISPDEFYDLHRPEIDANSFYQKLRIFEMLHHPSNVPPARS